MLAAAPLGTGHAARHSHRTARQELHRSVAVYRCATVYSRPRRRRRLRSVAQTLGSSVPTLGDGADGNHDGTIDVADYEIWRTHFGQTSGAASGSFASAPEPSTVALLIVLRPNFTVVASQRHLGVLSRGSASIMDGRTKFTRSWFSRNA